jgi:hypothetical protein
MEQSNSHIHSEKSKESKISLEQEDKKCSRRQPNGRVVKTKTATW